MSDQGETRRIVQRGLYFEEFEEGALYAHAPGRTVTEADNVLFTTMTHNPAQLHLDEEYMEGTEFGRRIVNSVFTLGLMVGVSVGDTTLGTAVANLGWDEVRFPKPVFHGDTLTAFTEVLRKEDGARDGAGLVTFRHVGINQDRKVVFTGERHVLMKRRSHWGER